MTGIGCEVDENEARTLMREHSFLRAHHDKFRLDVFLPNIPFYEVARQRRKGVNLEGQTVMVCDAETLTVFKMLFFREKDFADVVQVLRTQGTAFDREWVRQQLLDICGKHDLRVARWDEIAKGVPT
jgi:hypothetical protein